MSELLDSLRSALSEGLKSKTLTSCYRWASNRRIMGGDFAGPYSDKFHPWVREIHDTKAPYNWAMKGAQLGVTEVAINRAFYVLDVLRRDVLYVLPTNINASDFSRSRFATALNESPYLADMFVETNTVNLKQTATNTLYIRGSRGDSNLKSIPVSELILDEVDEMEWKQIELAKTRLDGQLRKSVFGISTPTLPNRGIHKLFLDSTQEHYYFRCPSCSRYTELVWPDSVEIIGDSAADPRCAESYLKCKECKAKLEHKDKPYWLGKTGVWKPTAENANPDIRGFYINQLYSFTKTPGSLVEAHFRGFGDELSAKEFHNSRLGLPFIGTGAQVTDDDLTRCIGTHTTKDPRPDRGGRIITMGVDQGKWNYYEINEWFFPRWGNDINAVAQCKVLDIGKFLEDERDERLDALMREWQVMACVIDADPEIAEARRFARRFEGFVWLCRYRRGITAREIAISEEDSGAPIATVDRTSWFSVSLGRFRSKDRIFLPRDVPEQYLAHQKALVRTYERDDSGNPRAVYAATADDHYAHARNYAEIALPLVAARETQQDIKKFL